LAGLIPNGDLAPIRPDGPRRAPQTHL